MPPKKNNIDDALEALKIELTQEEIHYLEEPYQPHPIIGAIFKNPPMGTILLDEKK